MNLKKPLQSIIPEDLLAYVFKSHEVIGDVAIISIAPSFNHLEKEIAKVILEAYPDLRLVAKRLSNHSGEFRIARLQKIDGDGSFVTVHKEFGLSLHVDPENGYFSPRSSTERYRIAQQVKQDEHVLVMFSGVGPFALMIGLHSQASAIIGVEKNSRAHQLAMKNKEVNTKAKNIDFLCGDVLNVLPSLNKNFDRIVMPLPLSGAKYLPLALRYLLPGGMLHFYDFQYRDEFEFSRTAVADACQGEGRGVADSAIHQCGHIGSRRYRVCVDAKIH
jgi:tRNA (guanine37-N1)-methyltransferase